MYHIIALSLVAEIGPVLARFLIAYCGGARAVFESTERELAAIPNIGERRARILKEFDDFQKVDELMEFNEKNGVTVVSYLDEDYPSRLKPYDHAPLLLFKTGTCSLNHHRTVGIVGTRKPTEYGKNFCAKLVSDLKKYDVHIISGLAYGIDAAAHRASLEHDIPTVGVLGHGLDIIYPAAHRGLAHKMKKDGALLTEFPIRSRADREHFPMRNRIIAMLSDALIVVESAKKGGSMITAQFANDFNKDVFALPGKVSDDYSQGCNLLIKSHRAHLLEKAEDISYIMGWDAHKKGVQTKLFENLSDDEKHIIEIIKEFPEIGIDDLHQKVQVHHSTLASLLISIEFKGVLKALPGKKYLAL